MWLTHCNKLPKVPKVPVIVQRMMTCGGAHVPRHRGHAADMSPLLFYSLRMREANEFVEEEIHHGLTKLGMVLHMKIWNEEPQGEVEKYQEGGGQGSMTFPEVFLPLTRNIVANGDREHCTGKK